MSLTVAEQLLPQLLGTRLDKVCGRRYHERPLGGQSLDGGAREVLLSMEGLSPGKEGRKCIPVMTIRKFPEFFLWLIFTYLALLFLWFIFTIVEPEKWEGQNGQPKEEHLRC